MVAKSEKKYNQKVLIELTNVNKKFRKGSLVRPIFGKLSLIINSGDFLGIIGKSGSGKTLLLQCLLGFEEFDGGNYFYEGCNFLDLSSIEKSNLLKKDIAVLLRNENLIEFLSVEDNLLISSEVLDSKSANEQIEKVKLDLNLGKLQTLLVKDLDSLDYQKISLACCLIRNPKIIFMDEPMGDLNEIESEVFLKLIKDINQKKNIAIIVFSHDSKVAVTLNKIIRL